MLVSEKMKGAGGDLKSADLNRSWGSSSPPGTNKYEFKYKFQTQMV